MKHPKLLGLMFMALTLFVNQSCKKDEACEEKTWYHDGDADGEGDSGDTKKACDKPDGYVANANDPDDTNDDIFSNCTMVTYYLDNDGDTFGDPDQSLEVCDGVTAPDKHVTDNNDLNDEDANDFPGCDIVIVYYDGDGDGYGYFNTSVGHCKNTPIPENYVDNDTDCNDEDANINPEVEITIYLDSDGDTYGNPNMSQIVNSCDDVPENYVYNNLDCDDSNNQSYPLPGAFEGVVDGVDSNCDGYDSNIWTGPNKVFSKDKNDDWTDPQYQDMITEKVTFTRQDNNYLFNLTWWEDNIGNAPVHGDNSSDLAWEFWGSIVQPVSDVMGWAPTGGTKGVRWALLDPGPGNYPNTKWEEFNYYGSLEGGTHFYSLHNVASFVHNLDLGKNITGVQNDLNIYAGNPSSADMADLVGKTLGVWLQEDNIYFSLKITAWTPASEGGTITYERSTPITIP
jgi:hypothetical protein